MHKIVRKIRSLLESKGIPYDYLEHRSAVSSKEMAEIRGDRYSLSEGGKALVLKAGAGFVQVVIPGDKKFSNAKMKKVLGTRSVRFASPEELATITDGILPGAVPPFGNLFGLPVYADQTLLENENIVFNCGERTASIAMSISDYQNLVKPIVSDIVAP